MTSKEKAIRAIEALPENASLREIVDHLKRLEQEEVGDAAVTPAPPRSRGSRCKAR